MEATKSSHTATNGHGNLLGLISGISISWPSPIVSKLLKPTTEDYPFHEEATEDQCSWISSLLSVGAVLGSVLSGAMAHRYGRKITIIAIAVPFIIAYAILAFAENIYLYMVARVFAGFSTGGTFMVLPTYIGEICRDSHRGFLISSTTTFIIFGLLFSYVLGPYISIMAFNIIIFAISIAFVPLFYLIAPETPYFLLSADRINEALVCLTKLRGSHAPDISKELKEIEINIKKSSGGYVSDLFNTLAGLRAFFIVTGLVTLQQFSGINIILQYAQLIFEIAGSKIRADICSSIIGSVQFVTCFITPFLTDRVGRRKLLLISCTGAFVNLLLLGTYFYLKDQNTHIDQASWLPLLCLVLYIIFYNCGMGALPWAIMGELYPINVKAAGSAISTAIYWFFSFLLTQYFSALYHAINMGPSFWLFSGFCILNNIFVFLFLIETKGKSLEEIQDILRQRRKI